MRLKWLAICLALVCIAGGWSYWHYLYEPYQRRQTLSLKPFRDPAEAEQMEEKAREKLAFVSLETRLPKPTGLAPAPALAPEAAQRWQKLETEMDSRSSTRATFLKALHNKARKFFLGSLGSGSGRKMLFWDEDKSVLYETGGDSPVPDQPGNAAFFPFSAADNFQSAPPDEGSFALHFLHLFEFLHPVGFGYVKDHRHVAGFESHGFRRLPSTKDVNTSWQVDNILLVGIAMHDPAVVYLSDKLPSMELIRLGKTRPPDVFESTALKSLKTGEDLFVITEDNTLRMLGAIRATSQCLECHEVQKGQLLGAFSYTLRTVQQ